MTAFEIIQTLLQNRGITNLKEFLNPPHPDQISWSDLNITDMTIITVITIIKNHIQKGNKIAVYGDYDVDGICSTAILWSTIYAQYKNVFPHIPDRRSEGYGLSKLGIDHCISQGAKLIITVDSGIVAFDQIDYAKSQGVDVIVVDHHEKGDKLPNADAILHTTSTCAAGLSYFLARELLNTEHWTLNTDNLDLAALAVICDLVPLTGINRSIAKYGLEALSRTARPGLLALYKVAGISIKTPPSSTLRRGVGGEVKEEYGITAYHVGFILGPRLNATGRLTHALDSLRILCTNDPAKAADLAKSLNETNLKRQQLTESLTQHALSQFQFQTPPSPTLRRGVGGEVVEEVGNLIVVADPTYDEGVIGLIAAKLVEKHYRPAIAISVGPEISKASARSIPGFHITDYLRQFSDQFLGVGGHSMAAGFSFETKNLASCILSLESISIPPELLIKKERYDLEINLADCSWDLYTEIQKLQPFGLGNSTPVFLSKNIEISDTKTFGKTTQHLKFTASQNGISYPAVWFSPPSPQLWRGVGGEVEKADLYFSLDADTYRGTGNLQLIIKNILKI